MLQKIGIGAARHFRKEIATHRLAAVGKTELAQAGARALDNCGRSNSVPFCV
jgi:hypothetical protein